MSCSQKMSFSLLGKFLGYELKGYKIRRIQLETSQGPYWLKLDNTARDDLLRAALQGQLTVGDQVLISGTQEWKEGRLKLKVHQLLPAINTVPESLESALETILPLPEQGPKTQILVCQKSACRKRGGRSLCEALEAELREQNLQDRAKLHLTGCLKQCSKGPNLVIGRMRYQQVNPDDLPQILAKHFPQTLACIGSTT